MPAVWSDFLPEVLIEVPGCPEPLVEHHIRNAAIEFCNETLIWREDLTPIDSVIEQAEYTLTPPAGSRIVMPVSVEYDDKLIDPETEENLNAKSRTWRTNDPGTPSVFLIPDPLTILLHERPNSVIVGGIAVKAALKPTRNATEVADIVYDDWAEAVAAGALSRIMEIPDKPWTNPNQSIYYHRKFNGAKNNARVKVDRGHAQRGARVRIRNFV